MSKKTYFSLLGIALCAAGFCIENTGTVFGTVGRFVNRFIPCTTPPGNSFPCYGVYDIALMLCCLVLGVFFFGMLMWDLYKGWQGGRLKK